MDSATTPAVSSNENLPVSDPDTRAIPLAQLAADVDVHRVVTKILESAEEQPLVLVAMFSSAI